MSEEAERVTISASEVGNRVLADLVAASVFSEEMAAYKFAMGLGLKSGKRTRLETRKTKFNLGSFDRDGTVASLLGLLVPEANSDPYRAAEEYAETGLLIIQKKLATQDFSFSDYLE